MQQIIQLFIVLVISSSLNAQEPIEIGHTFTIKSEVLSEERTYSVNLPASYSNGYGEHYPVLYVLDGGTHFFPAAGVVNHMSSGNNANIQIPELIVVGVDNLGGNRLRDMTPTQNARGLDGTYREGLAKSGGADKFLEFLEKELVPTIDRRYRTKANRTIYGHSYAGLLALHSLLVKSGLFQNYIIVDANLFWDNNEILERIKSQAEEERISPARVSISTAGVRSMATDVNRRRFSANVEASNWLSEARSSNFDVKYQEFSDEDRKSVPLVALYRGLLDIFEGYWLPAEEIINGGAETLSKHYSDFSKTMGFHFLPSEYFVHAIVAVQWKNMDRGVALELLEMNVRNYPDSERAKRDLKEFREHIASLSGD